MVEIKTDEKLLQALRDATKREPTKEQVHEQRISYIMGSLGRSSDITREKVEKVLAAQEGR